MYYRGTDIAKYKHEATVISENVETHPDSISFSTAKEGCKKLSALFKQLSIAKDEPLTRAATAAVPEPAQQSTTKSPSLVYVRIRYSNKGTGFCVGWMPFTTGLSSQRKVQF